MFIAPLRALTLGLALLGLGTTGFGQTAEPLPGQVELEGDTYPYLLLPPAELVEGQSYPLVLFLHGAGERGKDNKAQMSHFPERMAEMQAATGQACFILAPNAPRMFGGPHARVVDNAEPIACNSQSLRCKPSWRRSRKSCAASRLISTGFR